MLFLIVSPLLRILFYSGACEAFCFLCLNLIGCFGYFLSSKRALSTGMLKGVGENILDAYVQDFLDLPSNFDEKNLRKAIIENLKKFILIFGKDFTFLGEECHRHVGL